MILAALAADAAPGINFRHFQKSNANPELEILQLWDEVDQAYELISPATTAGVAEQAQLIQGLRAIRPFAEQLPFEINEIVGEANDAEGSVVVLTSLGGQSPDLSRFAPGPFSQSVGEALAAIHSLPVTSLREAGIPEFDAQQLLHRKVSEVDRVAATGKVPAALLARWEEALEDVGLFRFHPTLTHQQINQDSLHVDQFRLTGISNWSLLAIADPAEDLRYFAGGALGSTFEDLMLHYRANRADADENLVQRAVLYSELELASWLTHCLALGDERQIAEAESMLQDLADQLKNQSLRSIRAAGFIGLGALGAQGATQQLNVAAAEPEPESEQEPEPEPEPESPTASDSDELF